MDDLQVAMVDMFTNIDVEAEYEVTYLKESMINGAMSTMLLGMSQHWPLARWSI